MEHREQQRNILVVPLAGLEPARCFHHLILSQARLPIPPQGQRGVDNSGGVGGVNAQMLLAGGRHLGGEWGAGWGRRERSRLRGLRWH